MFFDTHTHVAHRDYDGDREEMLGRARAAGVQALLCVGYDGPTSQAAVDTARAHDGWIFATVGYHPHDAQSYDDAAEQELRRLAQDPRVLAIGETGLDYYRNLSPREAQHRAFARQIALARELGKPLVIHDRDAHDDVVALLRSEGARDVGGIMHCFSGDWPLAQQCIEQGFFIALGGTVTFKNAQVQQEVAQRVPLEWLLLETDCPYLAPVPYRGKRNEPAHVRLVAEKIAELRGLPVEELASITTRNAARALRAPLPF